MKEIANVMNISPRTVESAIQTIRSKTGLLTRTELMKLAQNIRDLRA